jgi:hypothetical protein
MKERPILFSGPMVRAILNGTKTQTRRVVKLPGSVEARGVRSICYTKGGPRYYEQREPDDAFSACPPGLLVSCEDGTCQPVACPYGEAGDRLWVRESAYIAPPTFFSPRDGNLVDDQGRRRVGDYAATMDGDSVDIAKEYGVKLTSARFMPRWASRLLLEVVEVRAERLQSITEEDAQSEGIQPATHLGPCRVMVHARKGFRHLWDEINGKRAPWESNPWVWALTFKRVGE